MRVRVEGGGVVRLPRELAYRPAWRAGGRRGRRLSAPTRSRRARGVVDMDIVVPPDCRRPWRDGGWAM
jgi:hypothetical protein